MDVIGYFDEDFFLYFEETEMSYRIKKNGYKSMLVPDAKIVHLEGGSQSSERINIFKIQHFSRSRNIFFRKSRGYISACLVKYIFVLQAYLFFVSKRDRRYLEVARVVFKS